ncbi:MAG: heavy metal translocating P-type ATPase [Phycisphaerae bacterium]
MTSVDSTCREETPRHAIPAASPGAWKRWWESHGQLACALLAGAALLATNAVRWSGGSPTVSDILTAIAFALGLYFGAMACIESLRHKKLDINLLMVLGAVLAIFVGSAREGALLLFLFTLSGALERYAMQRTHAALESLTKLFPKEAVVIDDDGRQRQVKLEELRVGDRVLIKPGENVPADGKVREGISSLDESAITGEFMPREKGVGAEVYAGTLNTSGRLIVEVTRPSQDTTLAHIIHLVSQASEEKAPVERLFDRVGSWYTVSVLGGALIACIMIHVVGGVPWFTAHDGKGEVTGAFYRAITLLIVASPCALIISTPVVILSAIASCARRGIILKGGRHLESLAALKALVFDKTGTLTTGQVRLTGIEVIQAAESATSDGAGQRCAPPAEVREQADALQKLLLRAAASLEASSTHPLAAAVCRAAEEAELSPLPVTDFLQEGGKGLRGDVDGLPCVLGSPSLVSNLCRTRTMVRLAEAMDRAHAAGQTAVVLFYAGHAAILTFQDTLRGQARETVDALHQLGLRPLVMLTGDHSAVAGSVAKTLGLDEVRAELLPADKLSHVASLVQQHRAVGMVGDGINDAPALARATVGIAMGSIGSDAALAAADVVLLSDHVERLPWLIRTARRSRRVMAQNLGFAMLMIAVLVVCSLTGRVGLPLGVVGHEGSTLLVVMNGLRLLKPGK